MKSRMSMYVATILFAGLTIFARVPVWAQTFTLLHAFVGGTDGGAPWAGLVLDGAGNLYGTTSQGGLGLFGCPQGCGTVYKVNTTGKETVLHSFGLSATDGASPMYGSLFRDAAGNLYGTTGYGGTHNSGTVFRVSPTGKETVLYSFAGGTDGGFPYAGVVRDKVGNLYGTTYVRGSGCAPYGCGTVFKVNSSGAENVLYSFTGTPDGAHPYGLVRDNVGNLYGTTAQGGTTGLGTVFEVNSAGKETAKYSFTGGTDGAIPYAGVVRDSAGNLYGTVAFAGANGLGVVFKVNTAGEETVLYSFTGGTDGGIPFAGVIRDSAGNLYGTTTQGGAYGQGTVFKVDTTGTETVLHSFTGGTDGGFPYAPLVRDKAGNLYGTALYSGAYGWGTVFKVAP
jgi:uncharacterized repeat protein (TIGR03803 family)